MVCEIGELHVYDYSCKLISWEKCRGELNGSADEVYLTSNYYCKKIVTPAMPATAFCFLDTRVLSLSLYLLCVY